MFREMVKEGHNVDKWKEGIFGEAMDPTEHCDSIKRALSYGNCWFSSKRDKTKGYIVNLFEKKNGVNMLIRRIVFKEAPPVFVDLKDFEDCEYPQLKQCLVGNLEPCKCGSTSFQRLCKTKPLTEDYRCTECGTIQEVSDLIEAV